MKNIYLIGYMGSGKSTAGKKLANLLGYSFMDLDQHFEETYRISIMDFFQKYDEQAFRLIERKLLENTFDIQAHVISTGGGTACSEENMRLIKTHGISVYIQMQPTSLFHRLKNARRPRPRISNLSDEELQEMILKDLAEREKFYLQADYVVKGEDLDIASLAGMIRRDHGIGEGVD